MSLESSFNAPESIPSAEKEFLGILSETLDVTLTPKMLDFVDGTYELDTDLFSLSFVMGEEQFEIRNIEVRGGSGLGKSIVEAIHAYADDAGLSVIASNVKDTAIGFWRKMGYEEGETEGEYFRLS